MEFNNENEMKWIAQKILTYQDPETSLCLVALLESGIFGENGFSNYYSPRLTLQIRDTRVKTTKLQIEFQYLEISEFVEKIERHFSKGREEVFTSENSQVSVSRYGFNGRKDLIMSFLVIDRKPLVKVEIIDPTSNIPVKNKVVCLDYTTFVSIRKLFEQFRDNYAAISTNALTFVLQTKILDRLSNINMNTMSRPPYTVQETVYNETNSTPDNVPVDTSFSEEPDQIQSITNTIQNDIMSSLDKVVLPEIDDKSIEKIVNYENRPKEEKKIYSESPFIGTICDYSPRRLISYITSLIQTDENTSENSFCPISSLIETIDPGNTEQLVDINLYKGQLLQNIVIKMGVKKFLAGGEFLKTPVFTFVNRITEKNEALWKATNELFFIFIMFSNMYNSYLKYLQNNSSEENKKWTHGILQTQNFLRQYYATFFLSIRKDNHVKIKKTLIEIFNECQNNGFLKELDEIYAKVSSGGSLNLHQNVIEELFEMFIPGLHEMKVFEDINGVDKYLSKIKKDITEQISSKKDVKDWTVTIISEYNKKDTEKKEEDNPVVERIRLFLTCCGDHCTQEIKDKIMKECSTFEQINVFLRENSVPETLVKIKRVMDLNEHLNKRSDIMNYLKTFKEEEEVTETRVFFEETLDRNLTIDKNNIKVEDFSDDKVINFGF